MIAAWLLILVVVGETASLRDKIRKWNAECDGVCTHSVESEARPESAKRDRERAEPRKVQVEREPPRVTEMDGMLSSTLHMAFGTCVVSILSETYRMWRLSKKKREKERRLEEGID